MLTDILSISTEEVTCTQLTSQLQACHSLAKDQRIDLRIASRHEIAYPSDLADHWQAAIALDS